MIEFKTDRPQAVDAERAKAVLAEIRQDPMGGWFDLPEHYDRSELAAIQAAAQQIQANSQFLVCIGIGGSYLGHRALIEALRPTSPVQVLYAGNSLSPRALQQLFDTLGDADFSVNVISKSGTTTEPAVAFRFFKDKLYQKYGKAAAQRIYATTDQAKGALHDEAVAAGYTRFVVPDNIGGRYSVLTAVGLLPLAVAGVDVPALLRGAALERSTLGLGSKTDFDTEILPAVPALQYGFQRTELLKDGYDVEVLASFEPQLQMFEEWWKQLFGESEGKQGQGIFPASVIYTTDLHSLGQYMQEGRRNIFETVLQFAAAPQTDFLVPAVASSLDGLDYLEDHSLDYLNRQAAAATIAAHRAGKLPVLEVTAPDLTAEALGALVYFFELACAVSAKLSGVNPFDQPGVEAYKNNMFRLLGKPGF